MKIGRRVDIIDGGLVALELIEFLTCCGRLVSILEAIKDIAPKGSNKRKTEHMDRLNRLDVTIYVRAEVKRVRVGGVVFTHWW
ncbi:hypothetical protein [Mycobacterium uberis]|uniref:hypothetical protein n=1 Tax=Mycobacterium uberis TaxID=2162698 RepID=UPI001FB55AF4|nr:hypothetical protein [Mycobacterium uberis]